MAHLNIKQLDLKEGSIITQGVLNTIENNMQSIETYVESINHAEILTKINNVSVSATAQEVATSLNGLLTTLTSKGFMSSN